MTVINRSNVEAWIVAALPELQGEGSGVSREGLDSFEILDHWRSACVRPGVLARYRQGQRSAGGVDLGCFEAGIRYRLESAAEAAQPALALTQASRITRDGK